MDVFKISSPENWVLPRIDFKGSSINKDSPFYFTLVDYQVNIERDLISSYSRSIEVINDASRIENASLISQEVSQENERIVFHHLKIIRNEKIIDVLLEDNISVIQREVSLESHITNGNMTVNISIDDLRVGDCIDFASTTIEMANKHPIKGRYFDAYYWLNWACPVDSQYIRCINNSNKILTIAHFNTGKEYQKPVRKTVHQGGVYEELYENLSASNVDSSAPNWIWGDHLQVTSAETWQDVSSNLHEYYLKTDVEGIDAELHEIELLELEGVLEKDIIHIVRFVQNNIRYKGEHKGIYTHTPKNSNIVLNKRSGDCKDKSNLLVQLLKKLGVEARLLLVNTSHGRFLPERNPTAYCFNHMIVEVFYQSKSFIFDPTIQKQKGDLNHLTEFFYGWALPVTKGGHELMALPIDFNKKIFTLHHAFDFRRVTKGDGELHIHRKYSSHRADNIRFHLSSKEQKALHQDFLDYSKSDTELYLTMIQGISIVNDDEDKNSIETIEKYCIEKVNQTHDEKRIELLTNFFQEFPSTATGNYPVMIELDGSLEHTIDVTYDKACSYDDSEKNIKNQYFNYKDSFSKEGDILTFKSFIELNNDIVSQQDVSSYLDDVKEMRSRCNNLFPWESNINKSEATIKQWWFWLGVGSFLLLIYKALTDNF